jgi:hypothetical protein
MLRRCSGYPHLVSSWTTGSWGYYSCYSIGDDGGFTAVKMIDKGTLSAQEAWDLPESDPRVRFVWTAGSGEPIADRQVTTQADCYDSASSSTITVSSSSDLYAPGSEPETPSVTCPPAMTVVGVTIVRTIAGDSTADETLFEWTAPEEWTDTEWTYFECMDAATGPCELMLYILVDGSWTTCNVDPSPCGGWHMHEDVATRFQCRWGSHPVQLDDCFVFTHLFDVSIDAVAQTVLLRQPLFTPSEAGVVADRCVNLVRAGNAALSLLSPSEHPCMSLPIFIPGNDVPGPSQHKLDSIGRHPERVLLHHQTAESKRVELMAQGYQTYPWLGEEGWLWRKRVPWPHHAYIYGKASRCDQIYDAEILHCDEYPYHASVEGGPKGPPDSPEEWTGFTLSLQPADQNTLEGIRFGQFKSDPACGFVAGSPDPFLVVPLPEGPLATTWVCGS